MSRGDLYPCEKVCENVELARMGNINSGIDIQKASQILNIEDITSGQCKDCWAYRYCDFCIRYAEKEKRRIKNMSIKKLCRYEKKDRTCF
ncbi:MAG: SPASM domain-containing protein [Sellimonas intestinalis]|uniref:SPASM domain-containing protein n=1 Tax=Sellimonas intestinalis TaxID=1653434 RepID=UPI0039A35D19